MIQTEEAIEDSSNQYGVFYRVEGSLKGSDKNLSVVTVWLERNIDNKIQFITLKPKKEKKS